MPHMYLVLFRKPHTVLHYAEGELPSEFTHQDMKYVRQHKWHLNAAWRVDNDGLPVAALCRLVPGEKWSPQILSLPRLTYEEGAIVFWLTTERNFERRDILCDEVALYQADDDHYAFVFSMEGISQLSKSPTMRWT